MDKLDMILQKLESVDQRVDKIDQRVDKIDQRIDKMDQRIDKMDQRIDKLDQRMESMDNDIKDVKFILENEVRTNIMRVAEGHLDLSRNLKEAVKSNNEFEMLTIKVNMLESDVRELKRKIS